MFPINDFIQGLTLDYACFCMYKRQGNDVAAAYHIGRCRVMLHVICEMKMACGRTAYSVLAKDKEVFKLFQSIGDTADYRPTVNYQRVDE